MKSRSSSLILTGVSSAVLVNLPTAAHACTVCMGGDERTGNAINGAIFLMLGCIGSVLATLVAFAFYLMKRARMAGSNLAEEISVS